MKKQHNKYKNNISTEIYKIFSLKLTWHHKFIHQFTPLMSSLSQKNKLFDDLATNLSIDTRYYST